MPHKHFNLKEQIKWQRKIIRHDKWVIKTKSLHTATSVLFARKQLSWTQLELQQSLRQLYYSAQQYGLASSTGLFPPHHKLWICIHNHEAGDWGNRDTGHNGHYGGLQMHPNWGYGTSYYASEDSQIIQERAAEAGYKASGYSRTWLMGQWAHYDCLKYA